MTHLLLLLLLLAFVTGCNVPDPEPIAPENPATKFALHPEQPQLDVLREYYRRHWGALPGHAPLYDCEYIFDQHRDELLRTLAIADTARLGAHGVALVQFTMDGQEYRDAVWMRMVDSVWTIATNQFATPEGDNRFGITSEARADSVVVRANAWEETGSDPCRPR